MPVFLQPITITADVPATDNKLPQTGSNIPLNVIQLKEQIIEYVDGDVYRTVTGNVDYQVQGDLSTTIQKSETHSVVQDRKININGSLTQTVIGTATYVYVDSKDMTHVASVTNSYASVEASQQPTSWFQNYTWVGATYDMNLQFAVFNHQFAALNTQMGYLNFQAFPQNFQFYLSTFGINVITFQVNGADITSKALQQKVEALGNTIHGLAGKVGGARIYGLAAKLLGCVCLGPNQVL